MRMPNQFTFTILLLGSFIFDQEEDMDSALQDEDKHIWLIPRTWTSHAQMMW